MSNRILTAAGWQDRVRAKVGVDDSYLPDAVLQQPEVITVAEANVIGAVDGWESLVDDKRVYLEAAVVCECAHIVVDSMAARLPSRQKGPSGEYEVTVDWERKRANLEAERDKYLGKLDADMPNTGRGFFGLAGPQR
jgi:hypothetical protein